MSENTLDKPGQTAAMHDKQAETSKPVSGEAGSPQLLPQLLPSLDPDLRVILNVGGIKYETSALTLRKYSDTLLGRMFSDENMRVTGLTKPDRFGEYFIDRNGRYFECILDFYRTGQIFVPSSIPDHAIREEISFFQLPADERQILVQGEMWGDRIGKIAFSKALDNGRSILDKLMEHITNALNAAADRGCWRTTIDICRTTAYVRTSGGIIKRDARASVSSLASFYPPGTEEQADAQEIPTSAPQWHYNLIDSAITKWLCNTDNRRLLESHLIKENLRFTVKRELSFFVLSFHLFDLPRLHTNASTTSPPSSSSTSSSAHLLPPSTTELPH
jgi:hypothetical protein